MLCCALLWLHIEWFFPYPSGLLHWHCGNLTIAPVPAKQPWWIWINTSCEFFMNDCITTTKQSTTQPCAYFLGYTVPYDQHYDINKFTLNGLVDIYWSKYNGNDHILDRYMCHQVFIFIPFIKIIFPYGNIHCTDAYWHLTVGCLSYGMRNSYMIEYISNGHSRTVP